MSSKSDPLAQVLAEMLIDNNLNGENKTYGAYIVGQYWRFVVLEERNYFITDMLDSTDINDLTKIIAKLNWVKQHVEEKLKA